MYIYVVRMTSWDDVEKFYKIGITGNRYLLNRFQHFDKECLNRLIDNLSIPDGKKKLAKLSGFPYKIKKIVFFDVGSDVQAQKVEMEILEAIKSKQYYPKIQFPGKTECFIADDELLDLLVNYIRGEYEEEELKKAS